MCMCVQWPALLELACLSVVALLLVGKYWWMGVRQMCTHRLTVFKAMAFVVLFVEVLIVLVRGTVHMRVTRLVRPVFLVDCYYAHNVRR